MLVHAEVVVAKQENSQCHAWTRYTDVKGERDAEDIQSNQQLLCEALRDASGSEWPPRLVNLVFEARGPLVADITQHDVDVYPKYDVRKVRYGERGSRNVSENSLEIEQTRKLVPRCKKVIVQWAAGLSLGRPR